MKVIGEGMARKRGQVRERIFRVLLNHADKKLTKYRISKESEANIAWVIKTLRGLDEMDIIKSTEVRDYRKLVYHWRKLRTLPDKKEYMVQNPLEVIKSAKLKYALTTYAAENLVQKYLFPSRVDFYIDPKDKTKWHKILSQQGLVGKGNTRVLIGDIHVFYNMSEKEGFKTVSIPQLVVDLLREGGPCAEAAEMLIEKEEELVHRK